MTKKIHLFINNVPVEADEGMTILEAAKIAGIHIPTLCYLKDLTINNKVAINIHEQVIV